MKRRGFALASAAWLVVATPLAADPLPPPGYRPEMSSDEAGLWMQVDKQEAAIKVSPNLVKDPALNAYVRSVICKAAGDYCDTMRVYVVEDPDFNAYAMPNGAVVVFTGLLLRIENEAQLTFVLGHEVTHFLHRHTLDGLRREIATNGFIAVFSIGAAVGGVGGLTNLASAIGTGMFYSHSRDDERDADVTGFQIGVRNGYDPRQAPAIWRSMDYEQGETERKYRNAFLADHPATPERLATLDKAASDAASSRSDWVINTDIYRATMAPFLKIWISDELARGQPKQSVALFDRLSKSNPTVGLYQFARGEAYRKRGDKGDESLAQSAYRAALACDTPPAAAWRGLGLLALKDGDKAEAKTDFTAYRSNAPDADDKAMIDFYLTQL